MGIHNIEEKVENKLQNVLKPESGQANNPVYLSDKDREYFEEFYNWLRTTGDRGNHRIHSYLYSLQKILENHEEDLKPLTEEKIQEILVAIQDSEYKERGQGGYSEETKADYRKTIKRICEKENAFDLLPKDSQGKIRLKTYVPKSKKERTRPDQLPSVQDANKMAKKIEEKSRDYSVLRNLALFYTTYESGARIGEVLGVKIRDVTIKSRKTVEIRIPGNKESNDRKDIFVISAPVLKRYLESSHPDPDDGNAYLFCNLKEDKGSQMSYKNVSNIFNTAGKSADIEAKFNPHVFRKKRISFLKIYLNMNESLIDKKVGHVPGSDTTRIYTRIDDQEVIDQYKSAYGLEEKEKENPEKEYLWPKECSNCSALVEGHREGCHSCGEPVSQKAFGEVDIAPSNDPDMDELIQRIEEEIRDGKLDNVLGDVQ